jgi:hypothetical protein
MAMWLVIINPLSKLALTLTPVAMAFEVRKRRELPGRLCTWKETPNWPYTKALK